MPATITQAGKKVYMMKKYGAYENVVYPYPLGKQKKMVLWENKLKAILNHESNKSKMCVAKLVNNAYY